MALDKLPWCLSLVILLSFLAVIFPFLSLHCRWKMKIQNCSGVGWLEGVFAGEMAFSLSRSLISFGLSILASSP